MGERLDAQELRFLRQDIEAASSVVSRIGERVSELEDEIRARRAADLSAEEVEALEEARTIVAHAKWDPSAKDAALTALDKLLTKGAR